MASISQAENLPSLYCQGFNLSRVSNTTYSISPGQCRSYDNQSDIGAPDTIILDINKIGPNGVERLPRANSTWLAIYAVRDLLNKLPTCFVLSTNYANAPVLPRGYSVSAVRRIGWLPIARGVAGMMQFDQAGNGSERIYQYKIASASFNFAIRNVFTEASLIGLVPPIPSLCTIAVQVDNTGWVSTDEQNTFEMGAIGSDAFGNPPNVYVQLSTNLTETIYLEFLTTPTTTATPVGSMGADIRLGVPTSGTPTAHIWCSGFTDYL